MQETHDLQNAHDNAGDPDDTIQRMLNDAKRAEMEERYGARFFRPENSRIPPEVEAHWLEHIEEFQRRFESAETLTLRQFVELTFVRALADLPTGAVEDELEALLGQFRKHDVYIDFPDDVEAPEAYRFIVEELLDEPVLDIRMPGTRMHIIYGERA